MTDNQTETRLELETIIRQTAAAQRVNEMITMHLLTRIAGLTDDPMEFVRLIMMNIEDNLRKAARAAPPSDPQAHQAATDTVAYFEDLSMRMIAMLTPGSTKN